VKLLNYDRKWLIYDHVRVPKSQPVPAGYTKAQYKILCRLIIRREIKKGFFDFLLESLFELRDWKQLNYEQMYELIHVLTFWDYEKERM